MDHSLKYAKTLFQSANNAGEGFAPPDGSTSVDAAIAYYAARGYETVLRAERDDEPSVMSRDGHVIGIGNVNGAWVVTLEENPLTDTLSKLLDLAERHLAATDSPLKTSAEVCLEDAYACALAGRVRLARFRALKSLEYSVGILHPDAIEGKRLCETADKLAAIWKKGLS